MVNIQTSYSYICSIPFFSWCNPQEPTVSRPPLPFVSDLISPQSPVVVEVRRGWTKLVVVVGRVVVGMRFYGSKTIGKP